MAWTGRLHAFGVTFTHGADLRNPLSVLGPPQEPADKAVRSGEGQAEPAPRDGGTWQYLIANASMVEGHQSWTLLGPPTGVVLADGATCEEVASALAEGGWKMLATSPPAGSDHGPNNYIFARPAPDRH